VSIKGKKEVFIREEHGDCISVDFRKHMCFHVFGAKVAIMREKQCGFKEEDWPNLHIYNCEEGGHDVDHVKTY
jgi:hypothetical protein